MGTLRRCAPPPDRNEPVSRKRRSEFEEHFRPLPPVPPRHGHKYRRSVAGGGRIRAPR
jgi:hypothetical protein